MILASEFIHSAYGSLMTESAGASGGGINVDFDGSIAVQFIAFLCLILVLKPLLLDPFLRMIEERERRTDGARADARQMEDRSVAIAQQVDAALGEARRVSAQEREGIRGEGQKMEAAVLEQARQKSLTIVQEGKQAAAREIAMTRQELVKGTAALAAELAGRVLGREVRS